MSERIVIDPITRIEGHLRVEAEIEGGTIKNAYSSGTMVRGIENIVKTGIPGCMGFRRPCLRRMYFHPLACLGTGGRERTGYRDPSQRQYGS